MLQIEREIVQRENAYTTNEIDNRRLEQVFTHRTVVRRDADRDHTSRLFGVCWQLHAHFDAFNVQATLICGMVLGTVNADSLVSISGDMSNFCIYKQPIISCMYIVLTFSAIGTTMICIGLSFYIVVTSQRTANEISVTHTLALVRQLQSHIFFYYFMGLLAFFVSQGCLIWM